jgi:uncharacterized protein YgbK (DUF1537 family)
MMRSLAATLAALPSLPAQSPAAAIRAAVAANPAHKLIVLDDDPTGTQTVYDVPVLTTWDIDALKAEFARESACFYLLTNSRSLAPEAARALNLELARNLQTAAGQCTFTVVSRSDSTLRGHFPLETDALAEVLGPFDATFVVPYFEAGGRYTIDDVHYVAEGDRLVPAAETPFARDASFGYAKSNLREWIEEKSAGRIRASEVQSLSIEELRGPPASVGERLRGLPKGAYCVVNAAHPRDVEQFAMAVIAAERAGRRYLFRSAAQLVCARLGLEPRPPLGARELNLPAGGAGLIVVGSYVPKTTEQLQRLLGEKGRRVAIELSVEALLDRGARDTELARARAAMHDGLCTGTDVVIFTSRRLVTGGDAERSLDLGRQVSDALVALVHGLEVRPRYLVAKGGITSSDLATRGLGVHRAMVRGQILPGVPVWETGQETRFPGLSYVVFPGNVGGLESLADVWKKLADSGV